MTVFADAIDALFGDDNLAVDAIYSPPVGGDGVACRVVLNTADQDVNFGSGRQFAQGLNIEVRVSEIAAPVRGGTFRIGVTTYAILDDPETSDSDRLVWKCRAK